MGQIEVITTKLEGLKTLEKRSLEVTALKTKTGYWRAYKTIHRKVLEIINTTRTDIILLPEWAYSLKNDSEWNPLLEEIEYASKNTDTILVVTPRLYERDKDHTKTYMIYQGQKIYERTKGEIPNTPVYRKGLYIGIEVCIENEPNLLDANMSKSKIRHVDLLLVPSCSLILNEIQKPFLNCVKPGGYGILLDGDNSKNDTGYLAITKKPVREKKRKSPQLTLF